MAFSPRKAILKWAEIKLCQEISPLLARAQARAAPTTCMFYDVYKRRSVTLPDPAKSRAHVDREIELEPKKCIECLSLAISRSLTKFGVD